MARRKQLPASWLRTSVALSFCVLTAASALWLLSQGPLVSAAAMVGASAQDSQSYIRSRPFDPSGWLAWTGASMTSRARPSDHDLLVVSATKLLAPTDPQVLRAQAFVAFSSGDVANGLEQTAAIANMFPVESTQAFATLTNYVNHPAWREFIGRRASERWPRLNAFVLHACRSDLQLPALVALTSQVLATQPLDDETITCVGERAIAAGMLPTARWVWLNGSRQLPKTIANVFNGNFESQATGQLFDWRIAIGGEYREGFAAGIRSETSVGRTNHLLNVKFNRRPVRSVIARQYLALEPGAYTMSYSVRGSTQPATRVDWTISCIPSAATPTQSAVINAGDLAGDGWTRKRMDLDIPPACTGQLLELQVIDKLLTLRGVLGDVAFDDIIIVRR